MSRLRISLVLLSSLTIIYDCYAYKESNDAGPIMVVQSGIASWYGREEQGGRTASGEIFDRNQFTAASRHLPFNTVVRVTNRINGQSVNVRINDRGPYVKGRILDVSEAAAKALDMRKSGVTPVEVEVLAPGRTESEK
jgi:rare lipoprotein A